MTRATRCAVVESNGQGSEAVRTPKRLIASLVNERDEIGADLVPDYLGGWGRKGPIWWKGHQAGLRHQLACCPLGLLFYKGSNLPSAYRGGAFIGEHGSWDRSPLK